MLIFINFYRKLKSLKFKKIDLFSWLFIFLFSLLNLHAQESIRFKHQINSSNLTQSTITCIHQDSRGFIWIGTRNGLARYDGSQVISYEHEPDDSTTLSQNLILQIFEDSKNNLWIGTLNGLNLYNWDQDNFVRIVDKNQQRDGFSRFKINKIYEDSRENLWISDGSLILFNRNTNEMTIFNSRYQDQSVDPLTNIYEDSNKNFWVCRESGRIDLFNRETKEFTSFDYVKDNQRTFVSSSINDFIEGRDGTFWVGTTGKGFFSFRFNPENPEFKHYRFQPENSNSLSHDFIKSMYLDRNNILWLGTNNDGLNAFDINTKQFTRYQYEPDNEYSIGSNSIWSICEDREGRLLLGTFDQGLEIIDKYHEKFTFFGHFPNRNSLSYGNVTDFIEDNKGNMWIATDGGGLNYFDVEKKRFDHLRHHPNDPHSLIKDATLALEFDNQNNLWVGTWRGGINILLTENQKFYQYTPENSMLSGRDVFSIVYDGNEQMFIGLFGVGLDIYNLKTKKFTNYKKGEFIKDRPIKNWITGMYLSKNNNLWIIHQRYGLYLLSPDSLANHGGFIHYSYTNGCLSSNNVETVFEDSQNNLWVGTRYGLNLLDYKQRKFKVYTKKDGLPSNTVQGILEDDHGNLWLSTLNGLSKFKPSTQVFRNYDIYDGLQGEAFNRNAAYKTKDGMMYFGGVNGFNVFHPDSIKDNPFSPPVYLTDFKIKNEPVAINEQSPLRKHIINTDEIILSYNQSTFSFDFVALNYTRSEKNQYAYMLKGFDKDWNYIGTKRSANFTNIDPGEYEFCVIASNNDGVWNREGVSLKIKIHPPFWRTVWAYAFYLLFIISIIYFIIRYFWIQYQLRLEHIELEKLQELDQMKNRFLENISHEFRTPLTLMLDPLRRSINETRSSTHVNRRLKMVMQNADRVLHMTNQLLDIQKVESDTLQIKMIKGDVAQFIETICDLFREKAAKRNIKFELLLDQQDLLVWFDADVLNKIIMNLLSNAFKFTNDHGLITLSLFYPSANQMEIIVKDTGIGIPQDKINHIFDRFYQVDEFLSREHKGTGIGLALTKELISLYNGDIKVESKVGEGTTFIVALPCDNQMMTEAVELSKDEDELVESTDNETQEFRSSNNLPVILIVEDDQDIRSYIKDELSESYQIFEADNGLIGFEHAVKIVPDLIVSDIMMPQMDGIDMCKQLKNDQRTSHIPIILLTARSTDNYRLQGLQTGAEAYIAKPFNLDILQLNIKNLVESRKQLRERFSQQVFVEPKEIAISSLDEQLLKKAMDVVEMYMDDYRFDSERFCNEMGMSKSNLYRKIRNLTDQSPTQFIRILRLKRASQYLCQSQLTVAEIVDKVGFNDASHFGRCFREFFGETPSQYRSKHS